MENKKDETKVKKKDIVAPVKRAINRLARTEDGKVFINYLMSICGFSVSSLVINPNTTEINPIGSVYNESRKTVYYQIRNLIDKELLKEIEYMQLKEDADHDNEV